MAEKWENASASREHFSATNFSASLPLQRSFLLALDAVCLGADSTAADRSDAPVNKQPKRMSVISVTPERGDAYPARTKRITSGD